jgi:S-disulfanyl-L-cysteine oxidoreductase SoxD
MRIARCSAGRCLTLLVVGATVTLGGCKRDSAGAGDAALPAVRHARRAPEQLGLGHAPTAQQVAAIDIDANPAGVGLPPGQGTHAEGAAVFAQKCAFCHGTKGEGLGPYPKLIGAEPKQGFPFGRDPKIVKTIGNYWPYSTTVYDYVHRAMPFTAPGSLTPNETYALVAWLLAENEVIPRDAIMNAQTLPKVQMPARSHFVLDDRRGGQPFR